MDVKENLELNSFRRFGVELEINAFDKRNRPLNYESGTLPAGIHYVGDLVQRTTGNNVVIHKWGNDHHNQTWIIKPDASCGMEVCTPVLKGWVGIKELTSVVEAFRRDDNIQVDERCSLHVHVDVSGLSIHEIARIITWWVKCEPVFVDSVPNERKKNQYCQLLGQTDIFDHVENGLLPEQTVINRLGHSKYFTMNTFHFVNDKRKTIEFRIMDSLSCKNPSNAQNWVRLLLHFVERALIKNVKPSYVSGDKWSSYCWLDPLDVFEFLGFAPEQANLSPGLHQVRNWFIERLIANKNSNMKGVMSNKGRRFAHQQIDKLQDICEKQPDNIFEEVFRV